MPATAQAFNRILDDLARRQLLLDFQFGAAGSSYEAIRNIGSGAFGIVCEAVETNSGTKVAIKKIGHASATPTSARRTLREIRVLRYIAHDNIVGLRDIFRTPGNLGINVYLVMDLMEGNLHHLIYCGGPMEDDLISHFLYQILRGLRYIHAAGIAHRDLKPSNLLVNGDCHLRIADFGMAKLAMKNQIEEVEEHSFYMTQHITTLPYRAPELLFVMPEHSTAVDLWAVACIFAEMIIRRELFPGRSVSGQIKIIVTMLGAPSGKILNQIQCERTRRLIENFGDHPVRPWSEIIRDKADSFETLDLIAKMARMDPEERIDVNEAIQHPYFKQCYSSVINEKACPFKVKMDMAAIETLSHEGLVQALISDVRGADETDFTTHSADVTLTPGDSSSGISEGSISASEDLRQMAFSVEENATDYRKNRLFK
ncbi:Mitogen-activated protein [Dirofilaria immitis]